MTGGVIAVALLTLGVVTLVGIGAFVVGVVRAVGTRDRAHRQRIVVGVVMLGLTLLVVGIGVAAVLYTLST